MVVLFVALNSKQIHFLTVVLGIDLPDGGLTPDPLLADMSDALRAVFDDQLSVCTADLRNLAKTNAPAAKAIAGDLVAARKMAGDGDVAAGLGMLESCADAITLAALGIEVETGQDDQQPVEGTVAFRKALLEWEDAQKNMQAQMDLLQRKIVEVCKGDEDLDQIVHQVDDLNDRLDVFDDQLQDILDDLISSQPGAQRDSLKKQALKQIGRYTSALQSDFFMDLDGNGFVPVNFVAAARDALQTVARAMV